MNQHDPEMYRLKQRSEDLVRHLRKLIAAPDPRPPQPITPAFRTGPSGAWSSMVGTATTFFVSREQLVMIEGTITPATPTVAALPRKLRLEIPEFFMLD